MKTTYFNSECNRYQDARSKFLMKNLLVSIHKWPFLRRAAFSAGLRLRLVKRPAAAYTMVAFLSRSAGAENPCAARQTVLVLFYETICY